MRPATDPAPPSTCWLRPLLHDTAWPAIVDGSSVTDAKPVSAQFAMCDRGSSSCRITVSTSQGSSFWSACLVRTIAGRKCNHDVASLTQA